MKTSKIKINPVTMEIEIEVSDSFLERYFEKLTERFQEAKKTTPKIKSIKTEAKPVLKAMKAKRKRQATPVDAKGKRGALQQSVLKVVKNAKDECVSASEIVKRTGLKRSQVYAVLQSLKSKGNIRTSGRGMFTCTADNQQLAPTPDMND